jgi:hypothetical protein
MNMHTGWKHEKSERGKSEGGNIKAGKGDKGEEKYKDKEMMNIKVCETFCPTEEKIADYPSLV